MRRAHSDRPDSSRRRTWGASRAAVPARYLALSTRPLHILAFLSPLIVLYEVGSMVYLSGISSGVDVSARRLLRVFFEHFGAFSLHLPGIALAVVLLLWHVLERDPWMVRGRVLAGMFVESIIWTLPLLVLGLFFSQRAPSAAGAALLAADGGVASMAWQARLTLSIGAGIYEELLFRLIAIAALHAVLVDMMRMRERTGYIIAALVASAAFAAYHDVWTPGGLDLALAAYYMLAGAYLSGVFIARGFGLAVAAHAWYDIVALVLLPADGGAA
ncbi:MAG: CPBP family intramembrane metalloprotease [Phycisphaeraceae bacterium]|nr:CPBP family intramembrane metalloprotease [Phycisphaerae bacterium]MBX3393560.1 CPBP family intramembrane metalloprotease [Phycisphaeraceae bacterium]